VFFKSFYCFCVPVLLPSHVQQKEAVSGCAAVAIEHIKAVLSLVPHVRVWEQLCCVGSVWSASG